MRKIGKIISVALMATVMSSCAENGQITRQGVTTTLGAIGGGILGSNVGKGKGRMLGAAVGALAGAAAGHWLGENLDANDRPHFQRNTQATLEKTPLGQTSEWNNPDSGVHGSTTPTRTFKKEGRYCREYTQTIVIGGKSQQGHGTACRQPDGTWEIIESKSN